MTYGLRIRALSAGYGAMEILQEVSFDVRVGEVVAILGPNGAGKTTLLNAVAGHLRPTTGTVELASEDVTGYEPHRRAQLGLAFIGDDRQLFPSLTVEQTLRLVPGALTKAIARSPELARLRHRRVRLLSGGEQQILAISRTLAAGPRVIVIDELSQGLAPMISMRLLTMLREAADAGAAVVVVEQGVDNVLKIADRGVVLRRGEVVADRSAAEWRPARDELAELFLT